MDILLSYNTLYDTVARSLGIIGKRSIDENGVPLFKDITIGSKERGIIFDYFDNAFVDICTEMDNFITAEVHHDHYSDADVVIQGWCDSMNNVYGLITDVDQFFYLAPARKLFISTKFVHQPAERDIYYECDGYYYKYSLIDNILQRQPIPSIEERDAAVHLLSVNLDPIMARSYQGTFSFFWNGSIYTSDGYYHVEEIDMDINTLYIYNGESYVYAGDGLIRDKYNITQGAQVTLTMPDNWNAALLPSLKLALKNYCVSYALHSWFTITAPKLAEKYAADAQRQMKSVMRALHEKKAPSSQVTYTDIEAYMQDVE
ncbi:hypothetical protein L6472_06145 [Prevotella sp. E13-17]|uniref:hypothetical protein n=1 Tax=Prevotella sp. E13-17 TaxID=2913616 RepID=UPI001ED9D51C|nr:hypothetical protein [Prevotella sp. E13-17]UKK52159.1 hypothetical protein L6472_06145 [Prevotella sp. E13-17]